MAEVDKDVHREEDLLSVRISNEVNLEKNNSACPAVGEQILATPSLECEKAVVFQTSTEGPKEDEQFRRSCLLDIIDDSGRGCGKKKETPCIYQTRSSRVCFPRGEITKEQVINESTEYSI